jgi:hypothetical protein
LPKVGVGWFGNVCRAARAQTLVAPAQRLVE